MSGLCNGAYKVFSKRSGRKIELKYRKYIRSDDWMQKREERLQIDGWKCVMCQRGLKECGLQVHHITYRNLGHEDTLHDLVTLCPSCHMKIHRYLSRKGNNLAADRVTSYKKELSIEQEE